MPTGAATRKAKTGNTYYYLQNATDVIPFMTALLTIDWNATLTSSKVNGAAEWTLQIQDMRTGAENLAPQDRVRTLRLGDVAVYNPTTGAIATMRIEQFTTDYSVP